ncbi:MAG: HlyD family efflux transporter periplasmic adaptor subunit [Pseudomonadota bacterium]
MRFHVFLTFCFLATLPSCGEEEARLHGYAEGRFRLLTTQDSGQIASLAVAEGTRVKAGEPIAQLDTAVQQAQVARAQARLNAALSQLTDSMRGGRAQQIEAAQQRLTSAKAAATSAQQDYDRIKPLFDRGVVAKSRLDSALSRLREAKASVAERSEEVTLATLPEREDRIKALKADVAAAEASLLAEEQMLARMQLSAPESGVIERVLRRPGEVAGPGAPIVRFLPDGGRHAILFVPGPKRTAISVGEQLDIECDGCETTLKARIDVMASDAEFTSPMIFSDVERSRLVYRLEAEFLGAPPPVGTPVWTVLK